MPGAIPVVLDEASGDLQRLPGGTPLEAAEHDTQEAQETGVVSTTSTAFVDIPLMSLTTKTGGVDFDYQLSFSASWEGNKGGKTAAFQLAIDGVGIPSSLREIGVTSPNTSAAIAFSATELLVATGQVISVQYRRLAGSPTLTVKVRGRSLSITGTPSSQQTV